MNEDDVIQKLLDTVQPPEIGKYDKKRKYLSSANRPGGQAALNGHKKT
jgi:hypothetical protein